MSNTHQPTYHSDDRRISPVPFRYYDNLSSWLWSTRMMAGLTQLDLADQAGVSRETIHSIETGRRWPSIVVALKLAAALGVTVEELFSLREMR